MGNSKKKKNNKAKSATYPILLCRRSQVSPHLGDTQIKKKFHVVAWHSLSDDGMSLSWPNYCAYCTHLHLGNREELGPREFHGRLGTYLGRYVCRQSILLILNIPNISTWRQTTKSIFFPVGFLFS